MKKYLLIATFASLLSFANADTVTFNDFAPQNTQWINPVVTDGFTFNGGISTAVWSFDSTPPGAFNGSPYLIWGNGDTSLTFGLVGGGSFLLTSLDLGLSWYVNNQLVLANIALSNGNNYNVTLDHTFQTFTYGETVTSVTISSSGLAGGYLALDNVVVNEASSVPETSTTAVLLCLSLAGIVGLRRKLA